MNQTPQRTRITPLYLTRLIAMFLLPILALLAAVIHLGQELTEYSKAPPKDGISILAARLEPLRAGLGARRAGYVAEGLTLAGPWPLPNRDSVVRFYVAQYALAPAVLHIPADAPLIVANFKTLAAAQAFARQKAAALRVLVGGQTGALLFQGNTP